MSSERPAQGESYRFPDGTAEIVFATAEGRVLTVREYRSVARFRGTVASAEHCGIDDAVADLPPVDAFRDERAPSNGSTE